MVKIISRFFAFCGEENRRRFHQSILLGVLQAFCEALKIPAIACMVRALLRGSVTSRDILLALGIMVLSIVGSGLIKAKSMMLQTEGGYDTCAKKRIEIAEHMRYLPMGYFNEKSLGQITSVTTNVMESLENVATRVIMMVCEGLLTTSLIIVMLFFFDWRIALVLLAGFGLFLFANRFLQQAAGTLAGRKVDSDERLVEKVLEYLQGMAEVKAYHLTGAKSRELNDAISANVKVNPDPPYDGPELSGQADRCLHGGLVLLLLLQGDHGRPHGSCHGDLGFHRQRQPGDSRQLLRAFAGGGCQRDQSAGDPGYTPDGHHRRGDPAGEQESACAGCGILL